MQFKYGGILEGAVDYYEGKRAAVVFTAGCPLRCGYCFSAPLILSSESWQEADTGALLEYFESRKSENDAVVFTGAEPFFQTEALFELCAGLKRQEFLLRVETSGFYAEGLERLLPLLDSVALDLKTNFNADAYAKLTGFRGEPATLIQDTFRTLVLLKNEKLKRPALQIEVRTTVIPTINDTPEIIEAIAKDIPFADKYALQQFTTQSSLVDPKMAERGDLPKLKLIELADIASRHVKRVVIRTQEDGEQPVEPASGDTQLV